MIARFVILVLLALLAQVSLVQSSIWWNLGVKIPQLEAFYRMPETDLQEFCSSLNGLTPGQVKLCEIYSDHMFVIGHGVRIAIKECQHQFKDSQWNCSYVSNNTVFAPVVAYRANRESAFVHALAAAATLQAISRGCKNGDISTCGCSKSKRPENLNRDWIWGGCGDNIEYGYKFAKTFIDIADKSVSDERYTFTSANGNVNIDQDKPMLKHKRNYNRYMYQRSAIEAQEEEASPNNLLRKKSKVDPNKTRARRLINLHNNEAGRRAVYKMVKVECKCHGVSGSCSMKTCWLKVPNFREIGDFLKEKYDSAIEVKYESKRHQLHERYKRYSKPTKEDLIYMDESPNFCRENRRHLIKGTRGRQCNKNSDGPDGCRNLCCGRGYYVERKIKEEQCNCKFQWCCTVKCETCMTEVETYICK